MSAVRHSIGRAKYRLNEGVCCYWEFQFVTRSWGNCVWSASLVLTWLCMGMLIEWVLIGDVSHRFFFGINSWRRICFHDAILSPFLHFCSVDFLYWLSKSVASLRGKGCIELIRRCTCTGGHPVYINQYILNLRPSCRIGLVSRGRGFDSQQEGLGVAFFATGPGLGFIMCIFTTLEFPTHNFDCHLLTTSVNAKYYIQYIFIILINNSRRKKTKEISGMTVVVYMKQNSADLRKL